MIFDIISDLYLIFTYKISILLISESNDHTNKNVIKLIDKFLNKMNLQLELELK